MNQVFYTKSGEEIPSDRDPGIENTRLDKYGNRIPRYNEDGREIIKDDKKGYPVLKIKFRQKMDIIAYLRDGSNFIESCGKGLDMIINEKTDLVLKQLIEFKEKCPEAVEYLNQVNLKQSEIWYEMGNWAGMKWIISELGHSPAHFTSFRMCLLGKNIPRAIKKFLPACVSILKPLFD